MIERKPEMTGSFRGPMDDVAARMIASITVKAEGCTTPEAQLKFIRFSLDDVREVYADDPAFVTTVCNGLMAHAERRGLLSAA